MKRAIGVVILAVGVLIAGWLILPRLKEWGYLRRGETEASQVVLSEDAITPENVAQIQLVGQRGWGSFQGVAWAPDGRSLALATSTGILLVDAGVSEADISEADISEADADSLSLLGEIPAEGRVLAVAFSPDGNLLAGAVEGKGVAMWKVGSTAVERWLEVPAPDGAPNGGLELQGGSRRLHFSADGRWVAGTWNRVLYVWEVQTGHLQVTLKPQVRDMWTSMLVGFLPAPGQLLYVDNAQLYTMDVETGAKQVVAPFAHRSDSIWAVDAIGMRVALGDCSLIELFSAGQDTPDHSLLLEDSCFKQLVFSADGQQLAALAASGEMYVIGKDGSALALEPHVQPNNSSWTTASLQFSPDGQSLAWVAAPWVMYIYRTAAVNSADAGSLVQTFRNPLAAIRAVHLEAGEQGMLLLDEGDRVSLTEIPQPGLDENWLSSWEGDASCPAFYGEMAGFTVDGSLTWLWQQCTGYMLLETDTGNPYGAPLPGGGLTALSPDGELWAVTTERASSSDTVYVKVYRTRDGKLLHRLVTSATYWRSLQFSPDGRLLLAVEDDGSVYLWAGEQRVFTWVRGLGWYSVFTPDGLGIVSGSKIVNLVTREESKLPELASHQSGEQCRVAVSPDSRLMARRADDGSIELWELAQVKLLHTLTSLPGRQALMAFSADGSRFMVVQDGVITFWGVK